MNNLKTKDLEIILCTYNEANFIEITLKEISKYLPDTKIIVVDDNSPDGTYEIVKNMNLKNVNLIKRKERGLAKAFIKGLKSSKLKYVGWADSNMPSLIKIYPKMLNYLDDYDFVMLSPWLITLIL